MLFPTLEFGAFFLVVLVLNWRLMPFPRVWKPFIIIVSYVCYGAASPRLVLVLIAVTALNQVGAVLVDRTRWWKRWQRLVLGLFIIGDLGALVYAKYAGFFAAEINEALQRLNLGTSLPVVAIGATVGISFYTFQGISYLVDVYRGVLPQPARTIDFFAYQAFFPHLFAGPIVRASELMPQIEAPRDPAEVPVARACMQIFTGLVKKLLIADVLGKVLVEPVFEDPGRHAWYEVLAAFYGYAAQIYCDFSGYTDIAIGLALLLGFKFPQNFDRPYASLSLQEFWRRWHISLSSWLRDYLYIPLGGSRSHRYRNLILTMLLGGLWHGANWTFVAWGGIHGVGLAAERRFADAWQRVPAIARWLVVFNVVCLAWVFFRAPDFSAAIAFFQAMVPSDVPSAGLLTVPIVVLIAAGTVTQVVPWSKLTGRVESLLDRLHPVPLAAVMTAALVALLTVLPNLGTPNFIYFQF